MALSLGFVSCDNFEEPNPPAQSNPQQSILQTAEVGVSGALVPGKVYDLDAYNNTGDQILVATIKCATLPEGYTFTTEVAASVDNFSSSFQVPSTVEMVDSIGLYNVYVTADNLNGVYVQNVTKNPAQTTLQVRFNVLTQLDNQLAYVGNPDNFYGPYEMTILPFQPAMVIEDAYYLVGNFCNWTVAQAMPFTHEGDGNVYDSPVFTLVIEVTNDQAAAGLQWKVIPQSTFAAGNLSGNTAYGAKPVVEGAMEGTLELNGDNGVVTTAGRYLITLNMEKGTYKFESALEYLSVAMNTGANINATQWNNFLRLYTNDYKTYTGTVRLYQNWFLSSKPAMDGIFFMSGGAPVVDEEKGVTTGSLLQTSDYANADKITGVLNGLYYMNVNLLDLEYTYTQLKTISIIGSFNDWDTATAVDLTHASAASQITKWSVKDIHMTAGTEYKFLCNHNWDVNYGGPAEDLTINGPNFVIEEEGTYDFELDFSVQPNVLRVTKK